MISASHNPYEDNGLKVFDHSGFKLPDAQELALEQEILRIREGATVPACPLPFHDELGNHYLDFLAGTFPHSLAGKRIVLDCANGAASELAPRLFARLGAEVIAIANTPNGQNINAGVGALYPDHARAAVLEHKADLGVSFDGDADRAILNSGSGRRIDGDATLLVCARRLKSTGHLPGDKVVATVMSNLGFELALREDGISLARTSVGDKYVLEEMLASGATIGGEQSGHVIFSEYATTGDGILTALRVLDAMVSSGQSLDDLLAGLSVFPQKLVNVRIAERKPLHEINAAQVAIAECETDFGQNGRVLVRFSGTEPLVRVMVEGNDHAKVDHHAHRIADALREAIGIK
jgi:phosphoglucosamine mutase